MGRRGPNPRTAAGWETLQRLGPGEYATWDARYAIRMIPWGSGRGDSGLWFVAHGPMDEGYIDPHSLPYRPRRIHGEAITESVGTMREARYELERIRRDDKEED